MKEISVILVTFNNQDTISKCLKSLQGNSNILEIIVVDNASTDETLKILEDFDKSIKILRSFSNLGFSKANNMAAKIALADYLLFLNPDTYLERPQLLSELLESLKNNPKYGLVGSKLNFPNGEIQPTVRNLPTSIGAFQQYFLKIKNSYNFYVPTGKILLEVESVVGACLLIKRESFLKVMFDEKYFLYFEDLDLCKRIRQKGFKVGYLPNDGLVHLHGASGKNQPTNKYLVDSAKKYHGSMGFAILNFILRVANFLKLTE